MLKALFGVMYICYAGSPEVCIEDHARMDARMQHVTVAQCTDLYSRPSLGEEKTGAKVRWVYRRYEPDGPSWQLVYNFTTGRVRFVVTKD